VEETGVPGENHRPVASHWQTLSHNLESSTPRHERSSNSQPPGRFEKILKAFFLPSDFFFKKIPVFQVLKRHYLPLAMIEYRTIWTLTIVLEIIS
jgi:hypothetical protein